MLEPFCKFISAIVNIQLMTMIQFHDDLHGFLPGCRTYMACLHAKLEAQLAFCSGRLLFHVYLDFAQAYNSLDWECTLIVLEDYRVGPNVLKLLTMFWDQHTVIPWQ